VHGRARLAALAVVFAAGCAGTRPYVNDAPANLAVRTELDRGVRAMLHVHAVGADCSTEYRGSVRLDRQTEELALPGNAASYLVVSFDTSSFLGGARSVSAGALLEPRPGRRYEIAVAYRDSQYDVALREAGVPGRALPRRDLAACGAR
jgi:hypothetical protein